MSKLQRVQNEAIRWMTKNYTRARNLIQQQHTQLKLEPVNMYLHTQARKIWNRLREEITEEEYINLTEVDDRYSENSRFRRSFLVINQQPTPIYF